MSGFITNPPAAMITDFALIAPTSENRFHITPVTAPESSTMSSVAPVSYRTCTPRLAARLSSRSITMLAPPVSPGTGTLWPRGAGTACLQERPHLLVAGEHQSLGVGLDHRLAREVAALELETQVFQPIEMLDAAVAVRANLGVVGLLATPRPSTCTSRRASRDDRSPAAPRSRRRGKSALRQAKWCRPPRRRARAPAPARRPVSAALTAAQPPPMPKPITTTSTSSDQDVTVSALTVCWYVGRLTAAPV